MDKNGDGKLDVSEFRAAMDQVRQHVSTVQ